MQTLLYDVRGVEYMAVYDTTVQHIPLRKDLSHLRPPPPRLTDKRDIFVGVASYRDGVKCGFALWTAYARAVHPENVFFGIVDQIMDDDVACIDAYCAHAQKTWPTEPCKYKSQITVDARSATTSKGPTLARAQLHALLGEQEFGMMVDAHVQFTRDWDDLVIAEWAATNNEMAVLSNYPFGYEHLSANATFDGDYGSHVCNYKPRAAANAVIYYSGILISQHFERPLLSVSWAGGFSFGKSHAWRRAPVDPYMNWVFYGEEVLHAFQLWTRGYDLYSPSRYGNVVFHNWTDDGHKHRFTDNVTRLVTQAEHDREETMAYNRLRLMFQQSFTGDVDAREIHTYGSGSVRSREQFFAFVNISTTDADKDFAACNQLHFVPYADPTELEALLPGWRFGDASENEYAKLHNLQGILKDTENEILELQRVMDAALHGQATGFQQRETADDKKREAKELAILSEMEKAVVRNSHVIDDIGLRLRQIQPSSNPFLEIAPVLLVLLIAMIGVCGLCRYLGTERDPRSAAYTKLDTTPDSAPSFGRETKIEKASVSHSRDVVASAATRAPSKNAKYFATFRSDSFTLHNRNHHPVKWNEYCAIRDDPAKAKRFFVQTTISAFVPRTTGVAFRVSAGVVECIEDILCNHKRGGDCFNQYTVVDEDLPDDMGPLGEAIDGGYDLASGLSFRQIKNTMGAYMTNIECYEVGHVSEKTVGQCVRQIVGISFSRIEMLLRTCWAFSIGADGATHKGDRYFDVRLCFPVIQDNQ